MLLKQYLDELPEERREVVSRVCDVILRALPRGYRESMNWGMICYEIPLEKYPDTYNGQPLMYLALAAQKNYYVLYVMGPDAEQLRWLRTCEKFTTEVQRGRKP